MKVDSRQIERFLPVRDKEPFYFEFEEDFVENNIRCIPMIVRFKMDIVGIKLKLTEWCKFSIREKAQLAKLPCAAKAEINLYKDYLEKLINNRTGNEPTYLMIDENPAWADEDKVDNSLQEKVAEYNWYISVEQWRKLNNLQRFTLLKLYKPGHENRNFPAAMREFKLI